MGDAAGLLSNISQAVSLLNIVTVLLGGSVPGLPNIGIGLGSNNPVVQQLLSQVQKLIGGGGGLPVPV